MFKKGIVLFGLFTFIVVIAGCGTIKGTAKGAAEGAKEDWQAALKADEWIKKNLW